MVLTLFKMVFLVMIMFSGSPLLCLCGHEGPITNQRALSRKIGVIFRYVGDGERCVPDMDICTAYCQAGGPLCCNNRLQVTTVVPSYIVCLNLTATKIRITVLYKLRGAWLSAKSSPSQAAKTFFHVLKKWSDGLDSGVLSSEHIDHMKMRIEKRKTRIFPTVKNKWVSLHRSFGLVCWCDDEQLGKEFMNLKNVNFLCFGQLSTEEKQMLRDKVSVLFRRLGIPSLSEVVTREAIYSGTMDNSFIAYFINGALPYAQRYIYSFHQKEYSEFKNLKIIVVEKLSYKNVIKKFGIKSSKQLKCSCLLQDNILYATPNSDSDSHSLFMELSRFLVPGVPELPLANFLHMISKTELSNIEEQMELFLTNKRKLLKLPSEESEWSMFSISSPEEGTPTPTTSSGLSPDVLNPVESTSKKL